MKVQIRNDQNEIMEDWYIGRDDYISSADVKEALDREFILAENEMDYDKKLTLDNFEM